MGRDMDSHMLIYYAAIGALLAFFAPQLGRGAARAVIGALVGIAAVALYPVVRQFF